MLATINDDRVVYHAAKRRQTERGGKQVEYHMDMLGSPQEILTNQVYDVNLSRIGYQDAVTTYDGGLGNPSHWRPVTFSNTWNRYYSNAWHPPGWSRTTTLTIWRDED